MILLFHRCTCVIELTFCNVLSDPGGGWSCFFMFMVRC